MNWSLGLGLIALLISLLSIVRSFGKGEGQNEQRFKVIDETLKRYGRHHEDHYQHARDDQEHFQDMEMHWTGRERDALTRAIDEMSKDIKTLLRVNGHNGHGKSET